MANRNWTIYRWQLYIYDICEYIILYIHVKKHIINHQYSKYSSCTSPSTWVVVVENAEALSFRKSWGLTCPVWMTHLNCILWSSAWRVGVWTLSIAVACMQRWSNCVGVRGDCRKLWQSNVKCTNCSKGRRLPCSPSAGPERWTSSAQYANQYSYHSLAKYVGSGLSKLKQRIQQKHGKYLYLYMSLCWSVRLSLHPL